MAGTVGHKLMSGKPTKVDVGEGTQIDVRCQVRAYSYSNDVQACSIRILIMCECYHFALFKACFKTSTFLFLF